MRKICLTFSIIVFGLIVQAQFTAFYQFLDSVVSIENTDDKISYVEAFLDYAELQGIPYIEGDTAHFIYYDEANSVSLAGDFNGWNGSSPWNCTQIEGTNFFYFSKTFEPTARLDYKYIIDGNMWILDPRNPNTCSGGYGPNSELAMSAYVQPWEIESYDHVDKGTIESFSITSNILNQDFDIKVYLPPAYQNSADHAYRTVYVNDGNEYLSLGSMNNVIDNLIDSSKIEPLIAVFIEPNNRNNLYAYSDRFDYAEFLVNELVPYIDANYYTFSSPESRMIMGASFGGNISGLTAFKYPETFGNTGWHSPAFWPNSSEVAKFYADSSRKDIRFYYNHGTYEDLGVNWDNWNNIIDVQGYEYEWEKYHEGHSWGLWRATIDDLLLFFDKSVIIGIDKTNNSQLSLRQNYPNPFISETRIEIRPLETGTYNFKVYNILGDVVYENRYHLLNSKTNTIDFNGKSLLNGMYLYEFSGKGTHCTKTMLKAD